MHKVTIKTNGNDSYTYLSKWETGESIRNILNLAKDDQFVAIDGLVIRKGNVKAVLVTDENEEWKENETV